MLSLSVNLKLPAHGTPSSPEKHASARGACFSGDDGGACSGAPPRRNEAGDAPRPHRKEYRQYRLAESLLAHRSHDVRSNTSRDCLLGEDSLYSFVLRFFLSTVGQRRLYALLFGLRTLRSVFVQVNNQIVANRHRVVTPPFLVGYANFPAARSRPSSEAVPGFAVNEKTPPHGRGRDSSEMLATYSAAASGDGTEYTRAAFS